MMKKLLIQAGLGLVSVFFGLSAQATCLHVPKSGMPAIFKGTTCTATATNVIAATVPSITSQNTVQQIPMPPNVAPPPLSSLKNIGVPSGPAAGFLYAFAGDNLSQGTPTSSPPPAPQPVCSCGGYAGTVYWSGWDSIGWETTPGGCYACPPPPSTSLVQNGQFTTGFGRTWNFNAGTVCNADGTGCMSITATKGANGTMIYTDPNGVTQVVSADGSQITTVNANGTIAAAYNGNTKTAAANVQTNGFFQISANHPGYYQGANVNGTQFTQVVNNTTVTALQGVAPAAGGAAVPVGPTTPGLGAPAPGLGG